MKPLLNLENISLSYSSDSLLDHVNLIVNQYERICLIGRNGSGKSSLLKIIEGSIYADQGSIWKSPSLRIATIEQSLPHDSSKTAYDYVASGLHSLGELIKTYHELVSLIASSNNKDNGLLNKLSKIQSDMDYHSAWSLNTRIETILRQMNIDPDSNFASLSGGWKRRLSLAKALVGEPDLLLMDEPTNHLDIDTIEWLENEILSSKLTILFITHDRNFLKNLATRIIELDRGKLVSYTGDYNKYLSVKESMLQAEDKSHSEFDKKLAQEEIWVRQGIKARRTRNEGRVRSLEKMREERRARRDQIGTINLSFNETIKTGKIIADLQNVSYQYNERLIINNFSATIMRGDKIGLIGRNGDGKTTLLNLIIGKLIPTKGLVKLGSNLKIAYFDQLQNSIDLDSTVIDSVAEGCDFVEVNGAKKHIYSYLSDFLFSPDRAKVPVKALSGGERNRLILAKLFSKPSNVLVLDEPTNDLDIETLEILEDILVKYTGTILLVSHDREFINNIVTSIFLFDHQGNIKEYIGGYDDDLRQKLSKQNINKNKKISDNSQNINDAVDKVKQKNKFTYKEKLEYESLPGIIENLEIEYSSLQNETNKADFYQHNILFINEQMDKLTKLEKEIDALYERWSFLENKIK